MLVLANGQRNLLRVPAGAGLDVGVGLGLGVFALAVAVAAGALVPVGVDAGVCSSVALGVGLPEGLGLTARCVAAGPQATRTSIRLADTTKSRRSRRMCTRSDARASDLDVVPTST